MTSHCRDYKSHARPRCHNPEVGMVASGPHTTASRQNNCKGRDRETHTHDCKHLLNHTTTILLARTKIRALARCSQAHMQSAGVANLTPQRNHPRRGYSPKWISISRTLCYCASTCFIDYKASYPRSSQAQTGQVS